MCPLSDFGHGCSTGYGKALNFLDFFQNSILQKKIEKKFQNFFTLEVSKIFFKNTNAYKNHNVDPNELKLGL